MTYTTISKKKTKKKKKKKKTKKKRQINDHVYNFFALRINGKHLESPQ